MFKVPHLTPHRAGGKSYLIESIVNTLYDSGYYRQVFNVNGARGYKFVSFNEIVWC